MIVQATTIEKIPIKLEISYSIRMVNSTKTTELLKHIRPCILTNIDFYAFIDQRLMSELTNFTQFQSITSISENIQENRKILLKNLNDEFTQLGLDFDSLNIKPFTVIKDQSSIEEKNLPGWIMYPLIFFAMASAIYIVFFT